MLINSLVAFLHFVAAFGIVATVVVEWLTFNRHPSWREARIIQRCDRWYGIFAAMILVAGFCRVFYFEKGSTYYFLNPFFHVKISLFLMVGLLSIYPTVKFLGWRKDIRENRAPTMSDKEFSAISRILNTEIILLAALLLSASLMAKGIGH